jgi:hypothetical protein
MKKIQLAVGLTLGALLISGAAWALQSWTFTFATDNSRGYTSDNLYPNGDWASGSYKSECNTSGTAMGLSATPSYMRPDLRAQTLLCTDDHLSYWYNNNTRSLEGPLDDRAQTTLPNWDVGYTKAECAFGQTVVGVAQSGDGNRVATKILCATIWQSITCDPAHWQFLPFSHTEDNRMSGVTTGDWDSGYSKNECAPGWIFQGVSAIQSTGEVHGILCCKAMGSGVIH